MYVGFLLACYTFFELGLLDLYLQNLSSPLPTTTMTDPPTPSTCVTFFVMDSSTIVNSRHQDIGHQQNLETREASKDGVFEYFQKNNNNFKNSRISYATNKMNESVDNLKIKIDHLTNLS